MDALMRKALPIETPETLHAFNRVGLADDGNEMVSHPLMLAIRKEVAGAADIAGVGSIARVYATIGERPEAVQALAVSGNFFDLLGVRPAAGRIISADDDRELAVSPVVVISHSFWERRFGGDPSAVGRTIRINGFPVSIVGVAQPGFTGLNVGNPVDVFAPLAMHHALRIRGSNSNSGADGEQPWVPQRAISWLTLITRAEPEAAQRIAQLANRPFRADIEIDLASRDSASRAFGMRERVALEPIPRGFSSLRTQFRDPLRALFAGVALILLITCANLAGLVLARGESRSHEMAIRSSLGALSGRLARQVAAESLTLAFMGGALGLIVADFSITALLRLASTGTVAIPLDASLSGSVLLFALGVTLLAGITVGLAPALRVRRFDLYAAFKTGGRVAGGHRLPLGRLLVTAQIALALILVTSAGVFARTFANFVNVDAGYEREEVITARIDSRSAGYTVDRLPGFHQKLLEAARTVPGVQSASLSMHAIGGGRRTSAFAVPGRRMQPGQSGGQENSVTPGYFRTMGISLLRGRDFTTADVADRPAVALVSKSFAEHFFGSTDVLGKRFGYGDGSSGDSQFQFEIIGVVGDARLNGLKEAAPRMVYYPLAQGPEFVQSVDVRVAGPAEGIINALRNSIAAVDANLPVREVVMLGNVVERGLSRERLVARLAGSFGILALALAAIGLYGVISYSVARRTNEMGVRLALGASPGGVSWLVMRDSLAVVAAGLAVGVILWFPVLGMTRSLVFGVSPHDPRLLAASVGVMVVIGLVAGLVPALRASRIDPIEAIRAD
jgi:predicted permease